jgi:hypothetical protein
MTWTIKIEEGVIDHFRPDVNKILQAALHG